MYSYIHIPFCKSKCKYCRFSSIGTINEKFINEYVKRLKDNILKFKKPVLKTGFLKSIYFGGGTPSILKSSDLENIIITLKNKFNYKKNIEITLETTPANINKDELKNWYKIGITRISMGIQTLNNISLKTIKRDNLKDIFSALETLKESKIKNISVDFIIGLPYVKRGEILNNIKFLSNNYKYIKHISVYMLEDYYIDDRDDLVYGKITYPKEWKNLGIKESLYTKEYLEIKNYLENQGFLKYELSNFSKKGYECKHNKAYWNHREVLGFGLGSHNYINKTRFAYSNNFVGYYKNKLEYSEKLTKKDIFLENILFGFRRNGIKKSYIEKLNSSKIDEYIKKGFLLIDDKFLKINDKYIGVMDKIIFDII